jgi:hypothetical protein
MGVIENEGPLECYKKGPLLGMVDNKSSDPIDSAAHPALKATPTHPFKWPTLTPRAPLTPRLRSSTKRYARIAEAVYFL